MGILAQHKKAKQKYEVLKIMEAGIKLLGTEVKSIKSGRATLEGAYIVVRGAEAFAVGLNIPPFQTANTPIGYDPISPRKLLLKRKEIEEILEAENQKGLTTTILSLYNKGSKIKAEVAIVRNKKSADKREAIKRRDTERELRRTLKYR